MSEDQFTKLFKFVEKRFDAMDKQFNEARLDRSAQVRDYHNEMILASHQLE